jgi:hypothetical protein
VDSSTPDAGFDASSDAGSDAGRDAGPDAAADAATDAAVDAATDAAVDAALDAAMDAAIDAPPGVCDDEVDLFPVPVDDATTLLDFVDDGNLMVTFTRGFSFPFFGTTYDEMLLGTNGQMVFGPDPDELSISLDEILADVNVPTIAPFWGDLDAGVDAEATARAMQMTTQQCDDRYVIRYTDYNDHDDETWQNTAVVTLFADGEIEFAYGTVETEDILVGVFDGTHSADMLVTAPFDATYAIGASSGVVLFDAFVTDATQHLGELNDLTIRFTP